MQNGCHKKIKIITPEKFAPAIAKPEMENKKFDSSYNVGAIYSNGKISPAPSLKCLKIRRRNKNNSLGAMRGREKISGVGSASEEEIFDRRSKS